MRRLSVRRSVALAFGLLIVFALVELVLNLHAFSSAAFMLRRAETSYRQLSAYEQLSIDTLEYMLAAQASGRGSEVALRQKALVDHGLATIDALTTFEVGLVRDNGGDSGPDDSNVAERGRLAEIRAATERVLAGGAGVDGSSDGRPARLATYQTILKPLMRDAVHGEQGEIATVEHAMRDLQSRMTWFGRLAMLLQIAIVGLVLALVGKAVLDPISRLVADIREFGRDRLLHRVDVPRHDEFGLLAQHINRMARHLERGRRSLVEMNAHLEATVAERTRTLQERNDALREVDDSRRRFFADVSHELRTPLTAIVGEADVTLRDPRSDVDACREALASILANSTYLNRRIDDLMALARSSDGQLELQTEIVDLNIVATEAMAEIRSLAKVNCVITQFEPLRMPILIEGDRSRLRQCLMILLDNAVKFSRAYQAVEVVLRDHGTHAELSVVDQGRGIAVEDLPRVFERFYQTEVGRRMGGTGLGLAIARRIVDAHKGAIAATSNALGGSAITITFPLVTASES